jgi:hypothetical protein
VNTRVKLPSLAEPPEERIRLLKPKTLTPVSPIDVFETDEHAIFELGSPAYRNACNRSGLGYIESQAELARFQGVLLRSLLTGKYYTARDPLALLAMLMIAVWLGVIPLALIGATVWFDGLAAVSWGLLLGSVDILFGLAVLGSFLASVASLFNAKKQDRS